MAVFEGSRYVTTKLKHFGRPVPLIDIRPPVQFDLSRAKHYTVQPGDRIDGIAYKQYGRADLYWAIMDANQQYFSEIDIRVGDVIFIPSMREVVKVARV